MRRLAVLLIVCALVMPGCGRRKKDKTPPPPPADYTAPSWFVAVEPHPDVPSPTPEQFEAEYRRVTQCWLDYWQRRSNGRYRPAAIPTGTQVALIEISTVRNTSAESKGRGKYGIIVNGWNHTQGHARSHQYQINAVGHRLSHVISGLGSGGNMNHRIFSEECGI